MKKLFAALAIFITLAGCTPSSSVITFESLPKALEDCVVYELSNSKSERMKVMRCPNSSTSVTYKSGKTAQHNIVIDGVTYEKKEQKQETSSE